MEVKYKCAQHLLTLAASRTNHASYDQFNGRGYDGAIGLKQEASQRGRSAIVVKIALRRIFAVELDLWRLRVKGWSAVAKH
jgi:hypothetical protein